MKTLIIMRHAKSSWSEPGTPDHDRVLNQRGLRNAPAMGRFLCENDMIPELIVTSSAVRARETTEAVAKAIQESARAEVPTAVDPRLYLAGTQQWRRQVPTHCKDEERVMIVGHNPGLEELVAMLTNRHESFPTATIAVVELDIKSWTEFANVEQGALAQIWRPKEVGIE